MSLCRPLLLLIYAPKSFRKRLAIRSLYTFHNAVVRTNTSRHIVRSSLRFFGGLEPPASRFTTLPPVAYSSSYISERVGPTTDIELKVAKYEEKRTGDPDTMVKWSSSFYLDIFHSAAELNRPEIAESVVSDILDHYEGPKLSQCDALARMLSRDPLLLKRETVLRVLQYLKDSSWSELDHLITRNDGAIARKMLGSFKILDTDRPFLRLFYPALLERLKTIRNPNNWKGDIFQPPQLIHAAFAIIQKLLSLSFNAHALHVFQALVNTGYVPSEALHNVDDSSGNPSLIILMTIIRSCLHWKYRALAAALVTQFITRNTVDKAIIDLNIEVIHSLLGSYPTTREVAASGHLIRRIHAHSPVSDSVIRLFYDSAFEVDAKEAADILYSFTRQERVLETHQYPAPTRSALPWLMEHFATVSSRTHLARTLATEAVDSDLFIPVTYRAQFIARTAALGYATQARALWERYSEGKDGSVVSGNSALMIRMVSLFWNMHKTNSDRVNALKCEDDRPGLQEEIERYRVASSDAALLAERVRRAFIFHHSPLSKAAHYQLTSLARACFIVGRISEGYIIFRYLLNRRECPDLYDCNVALTAIAQINPQLAVSMIEQMDTIGLKPDEVSYGTTLHYAVMQGNQTVVEDMIQRIRKLKETCVTAKTLANLIRAILATEASGSPENVRQTLASLLHLIKSFPEINLRPQVRIGKDLVNAAVRVKDGVVAYKLWKLLLRKAVEWDDWEHQNTRHAIGYLIRQPSFPLQKYRDAMLAQLAQKKEAWNAPTT